MANCKCGKDARYITADGQFSCSLCPISDGVDSFRLSDVPALLAWARQHILDDNEAERRISARMNAATPVATVHDLKCIIGKGTGTSEYTPQVIPKPFVHPNPVSKILVKAFKSVSEAAQDNFAEAEKVRRLGYETEYRFKREKYYGMLEGIKLVESYLWEAINPLNKESQ